MARDLVLEVVEQVRGNALGEAARDMDKLAHSTEGAGGKARDYSGELKKLDAQIESSQQKIRALGVEFVSTHEKAVGKDLRGERGLLRQLERIRKELEDAAPDMDSAAVALGAAVGTRAGQGFLSSFGDMVGELPSKLRGSLIAAVVTAVIAAAPTLGAVISGAVVGTVGAGGLVGGIAAASRDPALRAAAAEAGKSISAEFFAGGQPFVQPTIDALDTLAEAFARLNLGDSWARVAPYVTQVADGIAGMAEKFMPGFNRALEASGPALEMLASELPEIGDALSDMLIDISESKGTLEGWQVLLNGVEQTIRFTGAALGFLGDRFHEQVKVWEELTGGLTDLVEVPGLGPFHRWLQDVAGANDDVSHMAVRATHSLTGEGNAAAALADAMKRLTQEMDDYIGIQLSVDEANQRGGEAMLRLRETLKENGKHWEDNTRAGLANREALTAAVAALNQIRLANSGTTDAAVQATAQFEAQLDVLKRLAAQAGASKQVLDDLVGDYYVNIRFSATTGTDTYTKALARALSGKDFPSGFASGGNPPTDGSLFAVGERGWELMRLGPRPQVYSHQQSTAMVADAGASMRQIGETLATIVTMLQVLQQQPSTVMNVYPQQGMSERELAAVVQRELDWSR